MTIDPNAAPTAMQPDGLVERLLSACEGHPYAKIEWPHRILHEAAAHITRLEADVARLTKERDKAYNAGYSARDGVVDACRDRISAAEAQNKAMGEALERSATTMEAARNWIEAEHTESEIEMNGMMSEINADLHVTAYAIRATLSTLK